LQIELNGKVMVMVNLLAAMVLWTFSLCRLL
jgi:hypothetical protein